MSALLPLRHLTHVQLNCNFNPSRTANRSPTKTWADLEDFLPRLPDRLQTFTFGSLGRSEQFVSVRKSLVRCIAVIKTSSSSHNSRRSKDSKHSSSRKSKRRWKIEMPDHMKDRIHMLSKWGSPMRLDEVYLYR